MANYQMWVEIGAAIVAFGGGGAMAANSIMKRMKKKKIRENEEQMKQLQSKRDTLRNQLRK